MHAHRLTAHRKFNASLRPLWLKEWEERTAVVRTVVSPPRPRPRPPQTKRRGKRKGDTQRQQGKAGSKRGGRDPARAGTTQSGAGGDPSPRVRPIAPRPCPLPPRLAPGGSSTGCPAAQVVMTRRRQAFREAHVASSSSSGRSIPAAVIQLTTVSMFLPQSTLRVLGASWRPVAPLSLAGRSPIDFPGVLGPRGVPLTTLGGPPPCPEPQPSVSPVVRPPPEPPPGKYPP